MMIRLVLADRLKHFRESAGMTIYEVGEKIGRSGKTVSAWECGRGQPDADMLLTLCDLYGIDSIADLYGEKSHSSPTLTSAELNLLVIFRGMNLEGQRAALSMVRGLASDPIYKSDSPASGAMDA